jgi:hypothetical protein
VWVSSAADNTFCVTNVQTSAAFFRDKLGFVIHFLHGHPPFYGSVSRGAACLHLRFVHEPVAYSAQSGWQLYLLRCCSGKLGRLPEK